MPGWAVNGRFLSEPASGVQRVASGFLRQLAGRTGTLLLAPGGRCPRWWTGPVRQAPLPPGRPGRLLWEQVAAPALAGGRRVLNLANTAPLTGAHLVYTHDVAFLAHPQWFRPSFRHTYGRVTAQAARRAGAVAVPSSFTAGELARLLGLSHERVTVVPPGVDPVFSLPDARAAERVRARHRLPERFFLAVGSLDPRKGLGTAARAAEAAGLPLVVAGAEVAAFAGAPPLPGRATWLGRVPDEDLPALYAAATALLFPSLYEGFGLPPLEAMACGTPVVASDIAALRETLSGAALLCPPDDPAGWADAASRLASDPDLAAGLRDEGLRRAARYRWADAGAALGELMDRWPAAGG